LFLFVAWPVAAEIVRTFENPGDGEEVSDVSVVSGWAFSTLGSPVTVQVSIDGGAFEGIPCCGPRPDVAAGIPSAPANTSFSLLVNHKRLTPGAHTIAVQISAAGETAGLDTHTVVVAKPGGRVGENPETFFSFLSDLDISNAVLALDTTAREIIAAPVSVHDGLPASGGSGTTRQATLRLAWLNGRQAFNIVSAGSGTEFAAVQTLFNNRCASIFCHGGGSGAGGLNLSADSAFRNLVPVKSSEDPARFRVNPANKDASYLYQKVIDGGSILGSRMPLSGGPLSAAEIQLIADWINAGAPPPQ
jgi:hypothetical protein